MANIQRSSNIELLRIVSMLLIVLHHYCVNSGFTEVIDMKNITGNTLLIQFMAFGGKVGVNVFLLISGYFMIEGERKYEKIYKLIFQVLFYSLIISFLLYYWGGYYFSLKQILQIIPFVFTLPVDFIASYLLVYLLSPIINKCLKSLSRTEFTFLLLILLLYFVIADTFFLQHTWNYFGWAFTCYCVGAYIRMYNIDKIKLPWSLFALISLLTIWLSILVVDYVGVKYHFEGWTYMLSDANKLPVFAMAVFLFLYFKNMHIGYNRLINIVAASSLGVLIIHANSDVMRQWLWKDFLRNTDYFTSSYL